MPTLPLPIIDTFGFSIFMPVFRILATINTYQAYYYSAGYSGVKDLSLSGIDTFLPLQPASQNGNLGGKNYKISFFS